MNQNNAAQAATKEIREAFELSYAMDADDPASATDLFHFTNGWRSLLSKLRAPVADERALPKWLDVALLRRRAEQASSGEWQALARETSNTFDVHLPNKSPVVHWMGFDGADMSRKQKAANARYIAAACPRTVLALLDALASAPVAAEAQLVGYYTDWAGERRYAQEPQEIDEPGLKLTFTPDNPASDYWHPCYSAPQASAEAFKDLVTHGMSIQRVAPADFLADRQQRAGDVDDREAWAADMIAAGAQHLGDECWEWESDDFLFHLWQVATGRQYRVARADSDKKEM